MKGAIHGTEVGRPLLAAKGFNTNFVHFVHHVIISNGRSALLRTRFSTYTNVYLNSFACTNSRVRKIIFYTGLHNLGNNCNAHIAQYFKKERQSENEI